ncbi:IclR family transcriptional regulator [Quadrisphaera oryzae]|uniref:IclR family transcriptional regulator n=1 Tax=Quadrisphaera TaxID=317661 RepID=UPI001646DF37|nr:IclR family transcriptional regulator [Quadrisphaera sp. RL12-1S]MBC3762974.1 IclR family transcriptional regulator [Quadrisphaera sp. RL12-1S]
MRNDGGDSSGATGGAREGTVQSVDRAVSLLQALAARGPSGLTDLAAGVAIHKATAFRLLATLEARGLVQQDGDRGRYRLGPSAGQLAAGAAGAQDVTALCRPLCAQLAEEAGDTVNLVVSDGVQITTVDQAAGSAIVASTDYVGRRGPLHATAAGKVFLAEWPEQHLADLCRAGLERFTEHTLVDRAALGEDLRKVRERGWAVAQEEHEAGLVVVGAPVRGADGAVVAAMTVGGPTYRMTPESLPGTAARVVAAATRASWRLGAVKPG